MAAIKALEQWCKLQCDGYRDVAITNMTTSFKNGMAFCALIHKYRPDLIDYDSLKEEDVFENNRLVFSYELLKVLPVPKQETTWYSVRLCSKFNERVQADPKHSPESCSLHPLSYPYKLTGSALFIMQPFADLSGLSTASLFKAFQVAEEKLGIPALLDAEDMVALRIPDRLSILTYVSQYYNYFKGRPSMGGVKRPAEGSKEEPSEKKNLPVVAKTFVSKTATQNRLPSTLTAQTSPKLARATAQKPVLAENANKNGTLTSKCVACKYHVHLVQRHFVDGKLYHRSCFKCGECSNVLHAGGYKPGKNPDTFICNAHQNSCKPPSSEVGIKNRPTGSAGRLNSASQTQPAPRPSSLLSAPLNIVLKPVVSPAPPSQSWTASAHRTQTARQRFFQAAVPVTEASAGNRKPTEPSGVSGRPKVPPTTDDEKNRGRTNIGKKLAEENCNNNNKRPFTIRSAERRFGEEPSPADGPGLRKDKCSQDPAGNRAGQPATSQTNKKEPPCLKAIHKDNTKPTTVHTIAKDPVWGQMRLKPVKMELASKDAEAFTEQHKPGSLSTACSNVPSSTTRPPSAPTLALPPVTLALFDPAHFREVSPQKPQLASGNLDLKNATPSPVKSPPRRSAVESFSSPTTAPANHSNLPGAKKGKYLSPTNASRTEMRSPSVKSYHIPVEQIEKDLNDVERNLARLEKEGVELEKNLRSCEEEGDGDILMDPLMVDWFNLIRKKQMYIRKESELVYLARTQELEQQQPDVEGELRRLLETPDHLKSREEQQREKKLMQRLVEIVDGRNAIVEGLDEDRLREVEEDQQLNEMMQNLRVKKAKNKRKSSISKLFRRRSKRQVE